MSLSAETLKEILVPTKIVAATDFSWAAETAKKSGESLEEVLVELGHLDEAEMGELVAKHYGVPFVNLREKRLDRDTVRLLPEALARKQRLVLTEFNREKGEGKLAMLKPDDEETLHAIEKHLGGTATVAYATDRAIGEALRLYQRGLYEEFQEIMKEHVSAVGGKPAQASPEDLPVVRIVDTLIKYAYQHRASDIHFEPFVNEASVRFRVDGVLQDVVSIPKNIYQLVVTRLKVLASLRTDEHYAAQDGQIRYDVGEEELDIRVSILPIVYGEKAVLRLLAQKLRRFTLEDLGMGKEDLRKVREAFMRPHGMILSTGPTGSGKTTSLYAILKVLNTREVNITTVEDPVEYHMEGANQVQVNPRTNLNFAKGLRSILRQDPDIIMVGEIRDEETANIAVNAALTGHLVLSTLHTNDAATTLPRLLDMNVEPFLAASSVNVAIGQRLIRRLCAQCRTLTELKEAEREMLRRMLPKSTALLKRLEGKVKVYVSAGCVSCGNTGYQGRIGIFEVLLIDESIQALIARKATAAELRETALSRGMTTMLEDGVAKVLEGLTTLEEVLRAARE